MRRADLVLGAFSQLGLRAEVGEVREEFCPGDHSIRVGDWRDGFKVVGIAQRITRRATSVGRYRIGFGREGIGACLGESLRRHETALSARQRRQPAARPGLRARSRRS